MSLPGIRPPDYQRIADLQFRVADAAVRFRHAHALGGAEAAIAGPTSIDG